jgi:hypothetical protein
VLTAELVRARVQDGRLVLQRLDLSRQGQRAEELGARPAGRPRGQVGTPGSSPDCLPQWEGRASEQKLVLGLCKLIEDAATFAEVPGDDAGELRRAVFLRAAAARAADAADSLRVEAFDRDGVLDAVARERGLTVEAVEAGLFADLRGAQRLLAVADEAPAALISSGTSALRCRRCSAVPYASSQSSSARRRWRALSFRQLKFHSPCSTGSSDANGAIASPFDGPYMPVRRGLTKYGLQLALVLPCVLESCDRLELEAEVRWGAQRPPDGNFATRRAGRPRAGVGAPPPGRGGGRAAAGGLRGAGHLRGAWRPQTSVLELPKGSG